MSQDSAAALLDYFLAVLPHQQGETGATAAQLLLSSLQGAAQPAAALQTGSALLQHYMSQDLSQVCLLSPDIIVLNSGRLFVCDLIAAQLSMEGSAIHVLSWLMRRESVTPNAA